MRPLAFTAFPDRPVTVNPASVIQVEVAAPTSAKRHPVLLVFGGHPGADGERSMCVAEFADRTVAARVRERIGEHLWHDAAPPLDDEERRLIADNPASRDHGFVTGVRSVRADESNHPSLVFERGRPTSSRRGPSRRGA